VPADQRHLPSPGRQRPARSQQCPAGDSGPGLRCLRQCHLQRDHRRRAHRHDLQWQQFQVQRHGKPDPGPDQPLPKTASGFVAGTQTGAQYDGQGNLTAIWTKAGQSATEKDLTYDALARVTAMTDATGAGERYAYTAEGLRVTIQSAKGTRFNLYNDAGNW